MPTKTLGRYVKKYHSYHCSLAHFLAQAQKETSTRHIDILAYNSDGGLYFYAQKQKDKFSELEFDAQEDENLIPIPKSTISNWLIIMRRFWKP